LRRSRASDYLWSVRALFLLILVAGCGPACDSSNVCAVTGHPPDVQLCDGNDYRSCSDGNRGQVVSCVHTSKQAVCSPDGWAFQNASFSDGGQ
jgi:hypothetical protein